ncbi:MAG: hypothetical protein IPG17_33445 [Sandaracinaceae bacterium]|jgi:hypothetical protein|nr:hypothetical protein [Sandaracinaceae bacterium]MBK7150179.1 hypothetical protein [Sandaracinaceae bacterium]MBK7774246.1 hypothetical protein [Sandaracinaceae bacterium]MBK8590595.1 hypothetical protein [Sandaracinaceae bacterium]
MSSHTQLSAFVLISCLLGGCTSRSAPAAQSSAGHEAAEPLATPQQDGTKPLGTPLDTGWSEADAADCPRRLARFESRLQELDVHPSRMLFGPPLDQLPLLPGVRPPDTQAMELRFEDGVVYVDGTRVGVIDAPLPEAVAERVVRVMENYRILHPDSVRHTWPVYVLASARVPVAGLTAWLSALPGNVELQLVVRTAPWTPRAAAPEGGRDRLREIELELDGRADRNGFADYMTAAIGDCDGVRTVFDRALGVDWARQGAFMVDGLTAMARECGCDRVDVDLLELLSVRLLGPTSPPVGALPFRLSDAPDAWQPAVEQTVEHLAGRALAAVTAGQVLQVRR